MFREYWEIEMMRLHFFLEHWYLILVIFLVITIPLFMAWFVQSRR